MKHRPSIVAMLIISLTLSGCFAGRGIRLTRQPFNEAVQYTAKQQMLLNIVRLRYREPVQFMGLPNITESLSYGGRGGWRFNPHRLTGWDFGADTRESPTLSYQVLESDQFHRNMMSPITKDIVDLMSDSASTYQLLRMVVKNINDVDNASTAGGPTPKMAPEFMQFKIAAMAMDQLINARHAEFSIVLGNDAKQATEQKDKLLEERNSDMPPAAPYESGAAVPPPRFSSIDHEFGTGQSPFKLVEWTDSDFVFLRDDDPAPGRRAGIMLAAQESAEGDSDDEDSAVPDSKEPYKLDITYQEKEKPLVPVNPDDRPAVRFSVEALGSSELQTIQTIFRLVEIDDEYPFYEYRLGDHGQLRRRGKIQKHLWVNTRSFMEVMYFLSQGICIPQEHYDECLVTCTRNYDGSMFDWQQVTGDLLQVCVSKCKPKDASTAVKFKGYWYYIRDSDPTSKSTFNLLIEIYNLAVRGGVVANAPALTIGV